MVRSAGRRKEKFVGKVDGEVQRVQIVVLKPMMVEQEARYFADVVLVEEKVKRFVEGEGATALEVRDYINFGREMYKLSKKFSGVTLAVEAQLKVNKWTSRGLDPDLLVEIAGFFGVTPTAPPPTEVRKLDDLEDVEIAEPSDGQLLTYEDTTALWKNKDPSAPMVEHGNEWHEPDFTDVSTFDAHATNPNAHHPTHVKTLADHPLSIIPNMDLAHIPTMPCCRVTQSSTENIPSWTWTTVSFDTETYDTDNMFTSSSPTKITCVTAGKYLVCFHPYFPDNVNGDRGCRLMKNDVEISTYWVSKDATGRYKPTFSEVLELSANDYLEVQLFQTSGIDLNCGGSNFSATFVSH